MNNQELIDYINGYFSLRQHSNVVIGDDKKDRIYRIALASMMAPVLGYVNDQLDMSKETDSFGATLWKKAWPNACGINYTMPVFSAPPVPFIVVHPVNNIANIGEYRHLWYQRDLMWIDAVKAAGGSVEE